MNRSPSPRTMRQARRWTIAAALAGSVLLPGLAQAQGFLDPRGSLRLEFGWQEPGFDGGSDAALFDPIMAYGELVSLDGRTAWRPYAPRDWRPYSDGSWDYVPGQGWTWSGADPWSHITDHSGYWHDDVDIGWVWRPGAGGGRAPWEPHRVEWRLGTEVIGWAPISDGRPADPRHFVFIPIDGLIAPGESRPLDRTRSRAAYNGSQTVSPVEAASLSPQALASHASVNRDRRPSIARLPDGPGAPEVYRGRGDEDRLDRQAALGRDEPLADRERAPRYDSTRPTGRLTTAPEEASRQPPPVPAQRPESIAALPPAESPALTNTQPPAATAPARPTPPAPASEPPSETAEAPVATPPRTPQASAEAEPETSDSGPRVVGPQWLANGDCSSRGIREGRCRTD